MADKQRFYLSLRQTPGIMILLTFCLLLLGYGGYSIHKNHLNKSIARDIKDFFTTLLAGETLEESLLGRIRVIPFEKLEEPMAGWPGEKIRAALQIMAWEYPELILREYPKKKPSLSPLLARARTAREQGDYSKSEGYYARYWERESGRLLSGDSWENPNRDPQILLEIRDCVIKTDLAEKWLSRLNDWKNLEDSGFQGAFFMASCYEQLDAWEDAFSWYETSEKRSSNRNELRRSRWYALRLVLLNQPENLASYLSESGGSGEFENGEGFYDDLFDDYFSILVRNSRWEELYAALPLLFDAGLTESAEKGLFLLNRAKASGIDLPETLPAKSSENPAVNPFIPDTSGYVNLRSPQDHCLPSEMTSNKEDLAEEKGFYGYLLEAGYTSRVLTLWQEKKPPLNLEEIRELAEYLDSEKRFYDLIRFAGYWYHRLPPDEARKILPFVFPGRDHYLLPETDIPVELILGIIRQESAFHESIVSSAGAVGLMQLMPATAGEFAEKTHMKNWKLSDPSDNILLGSEYLQWLKQRSWTGSWIEVLAAYNAGGGNVRQWKRLYRIQDPELFIQAIPFQETRDYIRKVIVAAAAYRYLETGDPPGGWLDQFYRNF